MARVLITGGLGQLGLGVAEEARRKGYEVSLLGRSPLHKKPSQYRPLLAQLKASYQVLDVYDTAQDGELLKIAQKHQYWIHAAEPAEGPIPLAQIRLQTQYLYAVAKKAGFLQGNPEGKKMVRIGSPPPEIWEDSRYEAQFGRIGYVEDQLLDEAYCSQSSFNSPYFQAKMCLKTLAAEAFERESVAVLTAAPTLVIGPYGFGPYKEIWPQVLRGDWPFNMIYPMDMINAVPLTIAAEGILQAAEQGLPGESYQLAGPNVVMGYLLERIRKAGKPPKWSFLPEFPIRLPASPTEFTMIEKGMQALGRLGGAIQTKMDPQVLDSLKIINMIGRRNTQKAQDKLGFDPGGWGYLDYEIGRMYNWHHDLGDLS